MTKGVRSSMMREMTIQDYEQMISLWNQIDGLVLSEADSKANMEKYLHRNQGLSYVYEVEGDIVGTVLCGHDGRRGFIYHVAVSPGYRNRRIGQQLVDRSMERLQEEGIDKCHIFVLDDNEIGGRFWSRSGWQKRSGFSVFSKDTCK
ncbi:GNAT family N-acetyltransferase [Paenibacillus sp. GCM10023248]|uniref:GNAT family N-acetyltransferase n=1 Tax=Bacillales TaxID=1385 RepID=UPI002379EAF5|nr:MULTISPECIES: GNAT family N-acetyltransferase [Bacillales]MDD9268264.1 GNAT family N-acetyltransferase [Paenibacillus sp. MAHUQ-63]MDR6879942.1 ribosomal protein S18 acetylase RimI-like enzyme [Bacillus sp. 3255]